MDLPGAPNATRSDDAAQAPPPAPAPAPAPAAPAPETSAPATTAAVSLQAQQAPQAAPQLAAGNGVGSEALKTVVQSIESDGVSKVLPPQGLPPAPPTSAKAEASLPAPAAVPATAAAAPSLPLLPPIAGASPPAGKLIPRSPAQQQILESLLARQQQQQQQGGAAAAVAVPPLLVARPSSAPAAPPASAAAPAPANQSIPTIKISLGALRRPPAPPAAPAPSAAAAAASSGPTPLQPQPSGGPVTSNSAAGGSLPAASAPAAPAVPGPPPPPPAPPGPLFDPEFREVIHPQKMQWMAGVEGPHGAPLRALAATITPSDINTSRLRPPRTWWDSLTQGGAAGIHTSRRKEAVFQFAVLTPMAMPAALQAAEAAAEVAAGQAAAQKEEQKEEAPGAVGGGGDLAAEAAAAPPASAAAPAAAAAEPATAAKPEPDAGPTSDAPASIAPAPAPAAPQQPAPSASAPPAHKAPLPPPAAPLPPNASTFFCSVRAYDKYPSEYYIQGGGIKALYRDLRIAPGDALRIVFLGMDPQGRGYPILAVDRVLRAANPRAEAVLNRPIGPPRRGSGTKEPKAKKPRVPRKPRAAAGSRAGDGSAAVPPGGRKRKMKPTRADAGDGVFYDDMDLEGGGGVGRGGGWTAGGGYNDDVGAGGRPRRAKSRLRRFDEDFVDDYETDAEADVLPSGPSTDDEELYDGGYGMYDDVEMGTEGEEVGEGAVGGGGAKSGAASPSRSLGGAGGGSSVQNDPLDMLAGLAGEALDAAAADAAPAPAPPPPAPKAPVPAPMPAVASHVAPVPALPVPPALPAGFRPALPFRPGFPPMMPGAPRPFPPGIPAGFRPPLPHPSTLPAAPAPGAAPQAAVPLPPGPASPPPPLTLLSRKIMRGDNGVVIGAKLRLHWERGTRSAGDVAAGLCAFGAREAAAADVDDFEIKPEECCAEVVVRLAEPGRLDVLETTVAKLLKECK